MSITAPLLVFLAALTSIATAVETSTSIDTNETVTSENLSESTPPSTNEIIDEVTPPSNEKNEFIEMEIIGLEVLPRLGNAVALSWGKPIREYNLNWTYGVYYGPTLDDALRNGPKLETRELFSIVHNLTFCQQYVFAVGIAGKIAQPPQNPRTIATLIDVRAPPQRLQVDFIADKDPCLLIKWSASCPNIQTPLGYTVTVTEKSPSRLMMITEPRSIAADLYQTLRVSYGKAYDIKVASDAPQAVATPTVSHRVPLFLQPYKVRLTSLPDGTFMMYWREPYVPYFIGEYHYEVYVYPRRELLGAYATFSVNKPIFTFKGNDTEYTFLLGLRSDDGAFKSYLTDPIWKHLDSEPVTLHVDDDTQK